MAKWTKRILGAGVIAGAAYALWRAVEQRTRESTLEWTAQPLLSPPMPVPHTPESAAATAATTAHEATTAPDTAPEDPRPGADWVEPVDGACPASHPVKGKLGSGIFHVPGGQMYERTVPDRCYVDPAAAEAAGLRASKR